MAAILLTIAAMAVRRCDRSYDKHSPGKQQT